MKDGRDQNIDLGKGGGIPWCEREGSWETLPSLLNNGLCAMVRETDGCAIVMLCALC
jgi:hypothetical protein